MPEQARREARTAKITARVGVWLAVLAVVVAFSSSTVSFLVAHRESHHASQLADQAHTLAAANRNALTALKKVGAERRAVIHQEDKKNCAARHTLYLVVTGNLRANLAASKALIAAGALKGLNPTLQKGILDGVKSSEKFIKDMKKTDCTSVPSLENPKKKSGGKNGS